MNRSTLTLTAAGLLTLAASAIKPDLGIKAADRYDRVAAHPGAEQLSATLLLVSAALFVIAGVFVFADRPAGRGRRATGIGATLTALIGIWQAASLSAFGLWFALALHVGTPRAAVLPLLNAEIPGQHLFDLFLLCELIGPAALAFGLHRGGRAGWWLAPLWLLAVIGDGATEFGSTLGQVAALAVATGVLFLIGRGVDAPAARARVTTPQPSRV